MASFKACDLFLLIFRAADLGKSVCQDMWNRAGNNLKIPSELGVASTAPLVPLFQVKPPGGTAKIGRPIFVKFDGDYNLSLFSYLVVSS